MRREEGDGRWCLGRTRLRLTATSSPSRINRTGEDMVLKFFLLLGIAVTLCASASAQSTFQREHGNTDTYKSYRYKSIGFQNLVVEVADAPPVRYGVRQFAALHIMVLNEDRVRRVELDSDGISCDCGRRKTLSALPFRKITLPSLQIFAGKTVFPRTSYKGIVTVRWNL